MAVIIGLTGGIASGKSTVSNMLKELGIPVIDADEEARLAVEKGEKAYDEIVAYFGKEILLEDGSIDRPKLGSIIFPNEEKREVLNHIVHPAVRQNMLRKKEQYVAGGNELVVLDIPLLFESKLTYLVDKIILVFVDEQTQLNRLMARNNFTESEAKSRIASQLPLRDKLQWADEVINNNGSIVDTKQQLLKILSQWGYTNHELV
ncbi:dephospho-CoA kinase [Bacillus sp. DNRA2]|uniref:dephospho-CoA kinase n=1 Tax=Bacillus sp. DNRA2 TaxID=2723053 RepID=UPI00145DB799|nr:dephospho-CoA kinase [Bacillus sp. DNRA2]NMD70721.1 dephospho-CoA kinase [Bacillus sp. DNRA2]